MFSLEIKNEKGRDQSGKKKEKMAGREFRAGAKQSFYVYIATEIGSFHAFRVVS